MVLLPFLARRRIALLLNERGGRRLLPAVCGHPGAPVVFLGLLLIWLQVSPENLNSWPGAVMYVLMALLPVSLTIAEISFHTFERYFLSLKKRYPGGRPGAPA